MEIKIVIQISDTIFWHHGFNNQDLSIGLDNNLVATLSEPMKV